MLTVVNMSQPSKGPATGGGGTADGSNTLLLGGGVAAPRWCVAVGAYRAQPPPYGRLIARPMGPQRARGAAAPRAADPVGAARVADPRRAHRSGRPRPPASVQPAPPPPPGRSAAGDGSRRLIHRPRPGAPVLAIITVMVLIVSMLGIERVTGVSTAAQRADRGPAAAAEEVPGAAGEPAGVDRGQRIDLNAQIHPVGLAADGSIGVPGDGPARTRPAGTTRARPPASTARR